MNVPPRSYARQAIGADMTVRQIAADFPDSQDVFARYGEPERGRVRFGHLEPLTQFARRQGVPVKSLLAELSAATGAPANLGRQYAERVHHGFLLAALFITLSLGTGWGAWMLWLIGRQADFGAVRPASIIAHGEAQLWGFIALFVIGVSLRTVLQGVVRHPRGPWLCRAMLTFGLFGVAAGFAWYLLPWKFGPLGVAGGVSLLLMSAVYWVLQLTMLYSKWSATWARAVLASGLWLTIWAGVTICLRWSAGAAGFAVYTDAQRLLLIELAVFGFAMNSIYGFGQMLLPGLLRIGSTRDWALELSHWAHNAGTIVVCLGAALELSAAMIAVGCTLLTAGAMLFAVGNRGFVGRRRKSHREEQGHALLDLYPPLAFFWLVMSLALLTGGYLYEAATASPLPHAYMGAVRHALTVGFMTTLIMGVGQRLLPVLDRTVLAIPRLVLPTLLLIATGNLLRVVSELAVVAAPAAFAVMPYSALFEWLAIALFAVNCMATMYHTDPLMSHGRVSRRSSLATLLAQHAWIEDRLIARGMGYLERTRAVPFELTIGSAAESEGQDVEELVSEINAWLRASTTIFASSAAGW